MPAPTVKSKDELQQRLRDKKREWNSAYKDFSQKLKGFKDGLNGRGNAKMGLQPSNIKDPLPNEIGSLLHELATEFSSITNSAEGIIVEQTSYSQHRHKKQPKAPIQQPNAVNPFSALGQLDFQIEKVASNKITRFWQYISSYFSGAKFNKQRIGLLSQSADLYYSLLDFENDILNLDIKTVPKAISKFESFKYTFSALAGSFDRIVNLVAESENIEIPKEEKTVDKPIPDTENNQPKPNDSREDIPDAEFGEEHTITPSSHQLNLKPDLELDKIRHDIHLLFNANLAKAHIASFNEMFQDYDEEIDEYVKDMFADRIKERYESLLHSLIAEVKNKYNLSNVNTIEDVINAVKKNTVAESVSDYIVKTSHNALSRYMKRQLVKAVPHNKTAAARLEIVEMIDDMKSLIKKMMDAIEGVAITNAASLEVIKNQIKLINSSLLNMEKPIHILNVFFAKDFQVNNKAKNPRDMTENEKMVDFVLKRRLRKQLSKDLD